MDEATPTQEAGEVEAGELEAGEVSADASTNTSGPEKRRHSDEFEVESRKLQRTSRYFRLNMS